MSGGRPDRPLNSGVLFERNTKMRDSHAKRNLCRIIILIVGLLALAALSTARTPSTSANPSTSVNIVNNSSRAIRNVYLSHVNADDWSSNQLGDSAIFAGQSFAL